VLAAVLVAAPLLVTAACPEAQSAADRLQAVVSAESTARDALITIRRAAQDWKNLLLRGRDAAERKVIQERLEAQTRTYEEYLAKLREQLTPLGLELDRIQKLDDERANMFEGYRSALKRHGVESLEAAAAADREVQGSDVATFRALEQLIQTVAEQTRASFKDLRATIDQCGVRRKESAQ
jgi:methyl-accepting chemotaxis protein